MFGGTGAIRRTTCSLIRDSLAGLRNDDRVTLRRRPLYQMEPTPSVRTSSGSEYTRTPAPAGDRGGADEAVQKVSPAEEAGPTDDKDVFVMLDVLQDLSTNNVNYFKADDSEFGQRLYESYRGIHCHVDSLRPLIRHVQELAPRYDYDANVPGNGYRSFLLVVHSGVRHSVDVTRRVLLKRDQMLFRKGFYAKEIEASSHLLASLQQCLEYLRTLSKWSPVGELFPSENHTPYDLLSTQTHINQHCFYGRCLGFQFCEAMRNVLKFIILCMTSFSEVYFSRGNNLLSKATNSMWISGKYLIDPELRAKRVVNLSQNASIDFCKAFWFLAESEIMQIIPKITPKAASPHTNISVNKLISIPPEALHYKSITIPVPSAHVGVKPIQVRLISAISRVGMIGEGATHSDHSAGAAGAAGAAGSAGSAPISDSLLVHCHGGGFVAQSSRSHLVYLKEWAHRLNVPILSIDYSLAPEAPYPRAVQEILYAYVWALNNARLLGTTAKNIVFAGDSAGANLVSVLALKCIDLDIQRPNGIFLAYVPVVLNFKPTPARMLCLLDPLLPLGFMLRCIKSYTTPQHPGSVGSVGSGTTPTHTHTNTNTDNDNNSFEQITASDLLNAHKSLVFATDNTTGSSGAEDDDATISDNMIQNDDDDWIKLDRDAAADDKSNDECFNTLVHEFDIDDGCLVESTRYLSPRDGVEVEDALEAGASGGPGANMLMLTPTLSMLSSTNVIKQRVTNFVNVITNTFNKWRTTSTATPSSAVSAAGESVNVNVNVLPMSTEQHTSEGLLSENDDIDGDSHLDDVIKEYNINVPTDPYMSPYYAPDDVLQRLPPVRILTVELDPCLDDCVTYAKKLKRLECDVQLDILKGLPHGFLNFSLFSKEAHDGSKRCVDRIQELFNLYREQSEQQQQ